MPKNPNPVCRWREVEEAGAAAKRAVVLADRAEARARAAVKNLDALRAGRRR